MKPSIYLLFIGLAFASCQSILDKDPLGTLDAGSFFKTADDAVQAVNAAYQPLLINNENNNFYWAFAEVAADHAIAGGDGSRAGIVELDFLTHTPRTSEFNDFWKLQYKGINQANTVLEKVAGIDMDETLRNRILGEAYFLRALYYFQLTQVFGDVPLLLKVTPPDELKVAKTDKSVIYQQIIADADRAAAWLPAQYSGSDVGRATAGATYALAAKTHLYQQNWAGTLEYVDKVKALGVYALMPDFQDNFRKETQNNSESVFEVQHANLELGVGNSLNQWWRSKKVQGYGFAEVTPEFVAAFEPGDPRRMFTVAMNNEDYFGYIYKNSYSSTHFSVKKYLQDTTVTQPADGDINYTVIRYAEVLLWEAEALAELGRVAEAQVPLEEVRARARAQADSTAVDPLPMITTTDKEEMLEAIRHERQVELGFEMHRFFDLVRWGIVKEKLPDFQVGKHEVFPIPQTEIDLNPALVQNPGY